MKLIVIGSLLVTAVFGIAAQLSLKFGMSHSELNISHPGELALTLVTNRYILSWFLLSIVGNAAWMVVLKYMQVNIAYPIAQSLGYILLAVSAFLILGEKLTTSQLAGVAVMLVGIVIAAI